MIPEGPELDWRAAHRHRAGVEPIYDNKDVEACLALFRPQVLNAWFPVLSGVRARVWNARNPLGSASVEIELTEVDGAAPLRLMFSADIGPHHKLMHADPEGTAGTDYLIC